MGLNKDGYYTRRDIDKYNCEWNVVYGERAPGKSFDIKRGGMELAWKTKKPVLGLIRRNKVDIEVKEVEGYFLDRNINLVKEITNGEWEFISYYKKWLWWARTEEQPDGTMKVIRGDKVGEVFALSTATHYKSTGHPDIQYIIYEEFITDDKYLPNEPLKLMNLISTMLRKDDKVKIYLIGNTLSRVCPYFAEWGLKNIRKQKVGTIDIYEHTNTEGDILKIAVEHCPPSPHKSKLFFGRAAKSIQGGAWQTGEYPHLPDDYDNYSECYEMTYISIDRFKFRMKLMIHDEDGYLLLFIYPQSDNRSDCERVITSAYSTDIMWTPTIRPDKFEAEAIIAECFKDNKVVYSDNQTAQDFIDSCKAELRSPFRLV